MWQRLKNVGEPVYKLREEDASSWLCLPGDILVEGGDFSGPGRQRRPSAARKEGHGRRGGWEEREDNLHIPACWPLPDPITPHSMCITLREQVGGAHTGKAGVLLMHVKLPRVCTLSGPFHGMEIHIPQLLPLTETTVISVPFLLPTFSPTLKTKATSCTAKIPCVRSHLVSQWF
jgi:hypothetical protein